jgi:hypothetical protein
MSAIVIALTSICAFCVLLTLCFRCVSQVKSTHADTMEVCADENIWNVVSAKSPCNNKEQTIYTITDIDTSGKRDSFGWV